MCRSWSARYPPGEIDRLAVGIGPVERFQLVACPPRIDRYRIVRVVSRRGLAPRVSYPVQPRLGPAPAYRKVMCSVTRMNQDVGCRQRGGRDELLGNANVGRTLGFEVDGVDDAVAPVAGIQRALVFGGEFGAGPKNDPRRRAGGRCRRRPAGYPGNTRAISPFRCASRTRCRW